MKEIILIYFVLLTTSLCYAQTAINVDGDASEWENIEMFISDEIGDIDVAIDVVSMNDSGKQEITGTSYRYDVDYIKIISDTNDLFILIKLADSLKEYFQKNKTGKFKGGTIGTFYFDIDNNQSTGAVEFFTKLHGFDKKLTILVITTSSFIYSVGYWLETFDLKQNSFNFMDRIEKDSKKDTNYIATKDKNIELRIPLKEIGISEGETIRAIFSEAGQKGSFSEQFSKEIIKIIK